MSQMWQDDVPKKCDLCSHRFNSATDKHFYDFATVGGQWCVGCSECFAKRGTGLGVGRGQKYELATLKKVNHVKKEPENDEARHESG